MGLVSKLSNSVSKFFAMTVCSPLKNPKGQAAIFVALLFNVLFVFFAMAINVGLVIHDKINLQNSTDLAAYYVAAKQAELLNVIAHENYQIRQSYKLLTWRYRVLGTMGLVNQPYAGPIATGDISDSPYSQAVNPSLCIMYSPTWAQITVPENLCNTPNLKIPALPQVQVIAGFLGINYSIAALSRQLQSQFDAQCEKKGAYNWWFAMSILHAFRLDQRNRKQVIYALAQTLSSGQNGDFLDLDGNSVMEGARKTFVKNLTYANRQSFQSGGGEFALLNSLEGIDPQQWLPGVKIVPTIIYTDVKDGVSGCVDVSKEVSSQPERPGAMKIINDPFPRGLQASNLIPWAALGQGFLSDSDYQYSIGVEKNPWYMPYVGVKVKTTPRQIFFPFGSGVEMVARAFAKPFGGRIGPWYSAKWDRGAQASSGDKVDLLMAPRMAAGGLMNSQSDMTRLPNYSRFPGDRIGLQSKLAINSLSGLKQLKASFDFYKNIKEDMGPGSPNDILAWDGKENKVPPIREYEIAAIAPDLFDITYYSVEPNFTKNYWERLSANRAKLNIPFDTPIRPDLGHNGSNVPTFNVQEQMALAQGKNLQRSEAYYFIREKAHLLTSWLPGPGTYNYEAGASLENFGKCALPDDQLKYTNPGSCVAGGGRTGYSVKIVNRDALLSGEHKIGGSAPAGPILNPPKDGW